MTEQEWLLSEDPVAMCRQTMSNLSKRKTRLIGCAISRQFWEFIKDERITVAVEVIEQFADGLASWADLDQAGIELRFAKHDHMFDRVVHPVASLIDSVTKEKPVVYSGIRWLSKENIGEPTAQSNILRDIVGNPFKPVSFQSHWKTRTILQLAQNMYETRDFTAMPILGDALEEASCDLNELLSHCRDVRPHYRGCWVVDHILGKK